MGIDDLTLGELKELAAFFKGGPLPPQEKRENANGQLQIVVLPRSHVVVGNLYAETGDDCRLENASTVRRWGTSNGLGQLASNGPQAETKLDPEGTIYFSYRAIIKRILCSKNWEGRGL